MMMERRVKAGKPPRNPDHKRRISVAARPAARAIAARYLAIGATQDLAADRAGIETRTLQKWLSEPEYAEQIDRLRLSAVAELEPTIAANLMLALEIQREVFTGELNANNPRWIEAEKLIYRVLDKLLVAVEATERAALPAGPSVQVNLGNGMGQPGGPIYELPRG